MKFTHLGAIALFASTTACSGINYAIENYKGVEVIQYSYLPEGQERYSTKPDGQVYDNARTYRIFDKPEESRLMITPSLGASAGSGAVRGLTLGLADGEPAANVYRDVAMAYVASTGRNCTAVETTLIVTPQYEVKYQCGGSS